MINLPEQNWPAGLSTPEAVIQYFFRDRLTQVQVAKKLKISQQYVSKTIKNYRRRLKIITSKSVVSRLNNR